jgi:Domain of unknown function (DUF6456)
MRNNRYGFLFPTLFTRWQGLSLLIEDAFMPRAKPANSPASIFANRSHPDDMLDPAQPVRRHRIVSVNTNENALTWLYARGLISHRQLAAGERLRADFARGGLMPQVTMRWDASPPSTGRRGALSGDGGTAAMIDAKRRFLGCMDAIGAGLADIAWRVVCHGEAMTAAERALAWPGRSGRVVLALALDRIGDWYRLPG